MTYYGDYGFETMLDEGLPVPAGQAVSEGWACTTFAALNAGGDAVLGRNFDWYNRPTLLLFTDPPGGLASASLVDISYLGFGEDEPTEAQREGLLRAPLWPFDGMNEAGLAVGMMAVPHAEGGHDVDKSTLDSLAAIRLLLDYARDAEEAIALLQAINVDFGSGPPVHYLVADRGGGSAVVEYLDDEAVVIRSEDAWQVATNFVIDETPEGSRSAACPRYRSADEALREVDGLVTEGQAMAILREVSSPGPDAPTMWSVVYNMASGDIRIVMGRQYQTMHEFSLEMLASP
jgi:choloylglycine hydrolase